VICFSILFFLVLSGDMFLKLLDLSLMVDKNANKFDRFGTSERQWVEAQVENAKQQAILMVLKSQVTSDEAHIHLDLHSLR
jgi:HAUS augmin-like complex subunit 3